MVPVVGSPVTERKTASAIVYSLLPYGLLVFYGIIYLSILNTVNRERVGTTVKSWWSGDSDEIIEARQGEEREIKKVLQPRANVSPAAASA